jgi:hypothetical protein
VILLNIFRRIKRAAISIFALIPKWIYSRVLAGAVLLGILIFSILLVGKYIGSMTGFTEYKSEDYTSAIISFREKIPLITSDNWKSDFNVATAYYGANMQAEARENFEKVKTLAERFDNTLLLCEVDIDMAYSYEKSAENLEQNIASVGKDDGKKDTLAAQIRDQSNFYLAAYFTRDRVRTSCSDLEGSDYKRNQQELEGAQQKYQELMEKASKIDGKIMQLEIGDSFDNQKFIEHEKSVASSKNNDSTESNPQLENLLKTSNNAEVDFRNAEEARKAAQRKASEDDKQQVKPW